MSDTIEKLAFQATFLLASAHQIEEAAKMTNEKKIEILTKALRRIAYPSDSIKSTKHAMLRHATARCPQTMAGIAVEALEKTGHSVWPKKSR